MILHNLNNLNRLFLSTLCCSILAACTSIGNHTQSSVNISLIGSRTLYPSTYVAAVSSPVLIRGATILSGTGARLDNTDILLKQGTAH